MPFYLEDSETLTVDCGKGRSITLVLRAGTLDVSAVRLLWHSEQQVRRDQNRIQQFENDLKTPGLSDAEYDSITTRIKSLEDKPDNLNVLVDQIFKCVKGWTDCFANPDAEKRGEVEPFTKENIEHVGPGGLMKITRAIASHLGLNEFSEENAEPGEAKGTSLAPLQLERVVPGNAQTGIDTFATTEQ